MGVIFLVGLIAGAVSWSTRHTLAGTSAASARASLAWLDAAARQAGRSGERARLVFDLSGQRVALRVDGRAPTPAYRVELPERWQVRELWTPQREAFSGEVVLPVSALGHLPTHVMQAGPSRPNPRDPARWWVVAGVTGQRFEVPDRYAAREVLDALR